MSKSKKAQESIRQRLLPELQRRNPNASADADQLLEEFRELNAGGRFYTSDGDGRVSVHIPAPDGYEPPEKLELFPQATPTDLLATVHGEIYKENGIGRIARFTFKPLDFKNLLDGAAPELGLRGSGIEGSWAPLGEPAAFFPENALLFFDLAAHGGFVVRPEVDPTESNGDWIRIDPPLQAALAQALGRYVPVIVHRDTLEEAVARQHDVEGLIGAARQSLDLLAHKTSAFSASTSTLAETAEVKALLAEVLGEDWSTPEELNEKTLALAQKVLDERQRFDQGAVIAKVLQGRNVEESEILDAMASAFGARFVEKKEVSVMLLDAVLDHGKEVLGERSTLLRSARAQLQAEIWGVETSVARPTEASDAKVKEVSQQLCQGTQLSPSLGKRLATQLVNAVNVPSSRPTVLILAGAKGSAADVVYPRMKSFLGEKKIIEIQSGTQLRGIDPVGVLIGAPGDSPNLARSILLPPKQAVAENANERSVFFIKGTESVGQISPNPALSEKAQTNFWNLLANARQDGSVHAYDPTDAEKRNGFSLKLGHNPSQKQASQAIFVVRDERHLEALKQSMSPEAWTVLSSHVVDCGNDSVEATLTQIQEELRNMMIEVLGLKHAEVEFGASARNFLTEMQQAGASAATLNQFVCDALMKRAYFAGLAFDLPPKLRVELSDMLSSSELQAFKRAWVSGQGHYIEGIGDSPLELADAGPASPRDWNAQVSPAEREASKVGPFAATQMQFQATAREDASKIRHLAYQVESADEALAQADAYKEQAELRMHNLRALNDEAHRMIQLLQGDVALANEKIEDLQSEAKAVLAETQRRANEAIQTLEKDVKTANKRIEQGNQRLQAAERTAEEINADLKKVLAERDTLAQQIDEMNQTFGTNWKNLLEGFGTLSPATSFYQIESLASQKPQGEFKDFLLKWHQNATRDALMEAGRLTRSRDQWNTLAGLAKAYVRSIVALDSMPNPEVISIFEEACVLTGQGFRLEGNQIEFKNAVGINSDELYANRLDFGKVLRRLKDFFHQRF